VPPVGAGGDSGDGAGGGGGRALDPVQALYRQVVLDHYRKPRHREPLPRADGEATVHNPVCGDQVAVQVALTGDAIEAISARTRGCSIAVAAGSVMAELLTGAPRGDVDRLRTALERVVAGDEAPADLDERLRAFAGVAPHRARHRCATLPWEALVEALAAATS
jgi:nitrogen fixation NifU-like protein